MEELRTENQKIISYLTFTIGGEYFALNVSKVVNILEMQQVTKVPKSPEFMPGIINLRGEVLPVVDTNKKLGFGDTEITTNTCILVIDSKNDEQKLRFGALVDSVQEVLEIGDDTILSSPSIGESYKTDLIAGVVQQNDRFIMILDINKILDSEEIHDLKLLSKNQDD